MVDGNTVTYLTGGAGKPVVFLHGWGVSPVTYQRGLEWLARNGNRVYAPALPGFAGTANLPRGEQTVRGYATWVEHFVRAVHDAAPVLIVGHSMGGGVAIQAAHDFQDRYRGLVLVCPVGGRVGTGTSVGTGSPATVGERTLAGWVVGLARDAAENLRSLEVIRPASAQVVNHLLRNPRAVWAAADVARRADCRDALKVVTDRGLPVAVICGEYDRVVLRPSIDALVDGTAAEVHAYEGNHAWPLTQPRAFADVVGRVMRSPSFAGARRAA
jgi:pimeloyl-ACP methyl ester carboxylesterase